jgi:hypothetical protein
MLETCSCPGDVVGWGGFESVHQHVFLAVDSAALAGCFATCPAQLSDGLHRSVLQE